MIGFLISALALWLIWRWLVRSTHVVEIAPPPPAITVNTPSITINVLVREGHEKV
jgi:hypothetical protein